VDNVRALYVGRSGVQILSGYFDSFASSLLPLQLWGMPAKIAAKGLRTFTLTYPKLAKSYDVLSLFNHDNESLITQRAACSTVSIGT